MNENRSRERPFADLPMALVDEVIGRTEEISQSLIGSFYEIRQKRESWRNELKEAGLLQRESDLEYVPIPTSCGVDGSYAVERLLSTDLVAAAALAVEGLTPPSETHYWPEPQHYVFVESEAHQDETSNVARAVMIGMELKLAEKAPHGVVLLDGSLTTPLIYFNQALSKAAKTQNLNFTTLLLNQIKEYLTAYQTILAARRSDRCWAAIPKYTTRREIGAQLSWSESHDDRGLLTSILLPGEFTQPQKLSHSPDQVWHLNLGPIPSEERSQTESLKKSILSLLNEIYVLYYRPFPWLPALRLEMGRAIVQTPARLASVIHAVRHQCGTAAVLEPYPLYMADRMVKHLARAIPTFRQVTSQRIAEIYEGDIDDVFLGLHGYRTESGR